MLVNRVILVYWEFVCLRRYGLDSYKNFSVCEHKCE